jgi:hypothetical protein
MANFSTEEENVSVKKPSLRLDFTTLVISNLVTILLAIYFGCDIINILWIYWFQSIIIGLICVVEILSLKKFSTEEITPPLEPNSVSTKIQVAVVFIFAFGMFHFIYALFLFNIFSISQKSNTIQWEVILAGISVFFLHYFIQFISSKAKTQNNVVPNIGKVMIKPFYRIVPMHIIIILSVWIILAGVSPSNKTASLVILILFTSLKTLADIYTQYLITKKS